MPSPKFPGPRAAAAGADHRRVYGSSDRCTAMTSRSAQQMDGATMNELCRSAQRLLPRAANWQEAPVTDHLVKMRFFRTVTGMPPNLTAMSRSSFSGSLTISAPKT